MKTLFLVTLWQRFRDLCIKLISVKGCFALVSTYIFFTSQTEASLWPFLASWALLIGMREFEKIRGLLPPGGSK